ncbi:MAG: NAD-binding protein [Clostridia bacterium]|nr:NAD-binding protein [Clostridia bacterium]
MSKLCILGSDKRSEFLRKKYLNEQVQLYHYSDADFIICPIPFTRDNVYINSEMIKIDEIIFSLKKKGGSFLITGGLNNECKERLERNNINYIDIMESERFLINNSLATAEGTIKVIMENTDRTLKGDNVLIIGFGRIGKELARLLKCFGANVTVIARREEVINEIVNEGYNASYITDLKDIITKQNVIINTAPAIILNSSLLDLVNKSALIVDVASKPGGVDYMHAEKLGLRVIWELGIPSKYSPDSASDFVKEEVDEIIAKYE